MDLFKFDSGAAESPPSAPASPDSGYPTVGNPATGTPATLLGDYWFYQLAAELKAVLDDASIGSDHTALTQLRDALRGLGGVRPVEALPYPTICNSTNKLTVTPASASAGGTVSIAAGTWVELCEEIATAETGRIRSAETPAYTSADLDVLSTYYLRAQMQFGALSFYVQKGTDSDSGWSQGWTGTPEGSSGGGVDSSKLDMLVAKVTTGIAGTPPTVTSLANAASLSFQQIILCTNVTNPNTNSASSQWDSSAYNWARTPSGVILSPWILYGDYTSGLDCDLYLDDSTEATRSGRAQVVTRYKGLGSFGMDYMQQACKLAFRVTA